MTSLTLQSDGQRVLYLRHLDPKLWAAVQAKAAENGITLKQAVITSLQRYAGICPPRCGSFNHMEADEQCRESLGHAGPHVDHDGMSWTDD